MDLEEMSELCEESEQVVNSLILRYVLIFNVLCGVIAIPLIMLVIKATFTHNLVHYNIKWILIFHLLCLVAHDIFRIINHVWDLSTFLTASPGDCKLFSTTRCIFVRTPINLTMYLAYSSTFMLSVERCIATRKLSSYGKNRVVGPVLVAIQALKKIHQK
ncbi:hypothetical protein COOONC_27458 [Cooperia oncophora]